jgi:hypothetical protein
VFNGCVPPEKRDVAGRAMNRFEGKRFLAGEVAGCRVPDRH